MDFTQYSQLEMQPLYLNKERVYVKTKSKTPSLLKSEIDITNMPNKMMRTGRGTPRTGRGPMKLCVRVSYERTIDAQAIVHLFVSI